MKKTLALLTVVMTALSSGCAVGPVQPNYVPKTQYMSLDCPQLLEEYKSITNVLTRGVEAPTSSAMSVGMGMVLGGRGGFGISPSIGVDLSKINEGKRHIIAQYLGQRDAVVGVAKDKNCGFIIPEAMPAQSTQALPAAQGSTAP